ncbi:MAG: N-acetylmuramoyl-L-alanine amidase [Clostridiaceae bacterium]|nr:N-acetylmuramoyl-L-alanine amidase [Butyricicoccus pullicaecorum]MBS7224047.1 N-acetylmuramoyl-L-alanine amidase [Clostridiaceae bacterium]
MPIIYLSPSTQEYNLFYDGDGSEEYYMNLVADAMEPYLTASGIEYVRNTPDMTAASSIRASNAGEYDVHLALHSNAAPPQLSGQMRGSDAYYYPQSQRSRRLADIIVSNLKAIYPLPDRVSARPTTSIGEVTRTRAPAVLVELAYHDNAEDAAWIRNNIGLIARNLVLSLTEYFGIPFIEPQPVQTATVEIENGNLNIRQQPSLSAPVVGQAPDGARLEVLGSWDGWYVVRYGTVEGYVRSEFVILNYS